MPRRRTSTKTTLAATLSLCTGLAGCGGDPPATAGTLAPAPTQRARSGNQPPKIVRVTLEPRAPRPGEPVTARADVRDPEGDPITLRCQWRIAGREMQSREPTIVVEGARRGDAIQVSVVAHDATGASEAVNGYAAVGNQPPQIAQVAMHPASGVHAGTDLTAMPRASDPEGDPIEFRYRWRVNGRAAEVASATLPAVHYARGDRVSVEVWASDGLDTGEPLRTPEIPVVNAPPRITAAPGALGPDGTLRGILAVEDPDGDRAFRFRLLDAPLGMTLGSADGLLAWEPPRLDGGRHPVEVAVEDAYGAIATLRFSIDVPLAASQAPLPAAPAE